MSRELRYGLTGGFVVVIWMSLSYAMKWNEGSMSSYILYVCLILLAITVYLTILFKRDRDNQGILSFKEAFITGFSVSFVIGLMLGIFLLVYTKYIDPEYLDKIIKDTSDYYLSQHETKEQVDQRVQSLRAAYSPFGQLTFGIGVAMLTGAFVSLICAAIMRRDKKSEVRT